MFKTIFILFFGVAMLVSCKKEQPEMSELNQGCDCANEVSADFTMEEQSSNNANLGILYTNTDTIFASKHVRFTAKEKNAEYKWYAGLEEVTEEQFVRFFGEGLTGMNLPMTLVVKKKPNKICFPNDDGYDSITKYLHVAPKYDYESGYLPLEGWYRVYASQINDSIDIQLDVYYPLGLSNQYNLVNFDGLNNNVTSNSLSASGKINYREISMITANGTIYGGYDFYLHKLLGGKVKIKLTGKGSNMNHLEYLGRKL